MNHSSTLPDYRAFVKRRKTQFWSRPETYPGFSVEFLVIDGAPCQPIPGIGPEPQTVEIILVTHYGRPLDFRIFKDFAGVDYEDFEAELIAEILKEIPIN